MVGSRHGVSARNLDVAALRRRAQEIGEPEHFFVGLPEARLPRPRNLLCFCKSRLGPMAKDATHHRHMLIINLETEASMLADGLLLRLAPGQALLVFPFQAHRYLLSETTRLTWLFITFELEETDRLESLRNCPLQIPAELNPLVHTLIEAYLEARRTGDSADEVTAHLTLLLLRLLSRASRKQPGERETHLALPAYRLVQRACRLIVSRLRTPLEVGKIAREMSVSAGYLRNCFHRVLGMRVTAYIRQTRVFAACALLSRTESNITSISDHCGFSSVYAFSRAFTREVGMPPTRYRAHLWEQGNIVRPKRRHR